LHSELELIIIKTAEFSSVFKVKVKVKLSRDRPKWPKGFRVD